MDRRRHVVIVQPYVPHYRVPLFTHMGTSLRGENCTLSVLSTSRGDPQRRDAADPVAAHPDLVRHVTSSSWRVPRGPTLSRAHVGRHLADADLVVLPLVGSYLESYGLAARRAIALWGHGESRVLEQHRLDEALERWLLRRSRRFFSYTASGVPYAVRAGMRGDQVTVLRNTVDTAALTRAITALDHQTVDAFRRRHRLQDEPVLVVLGALDDSKRLDVAFAAADRLHDDGLRFSLLVAGDGPRRPTVEAFVRERPWAHYLGRVGDREKALLSAVGTCLVNPGRVGLVAVDSFALGLPIVTTRWPYHAPEFDYLDSDTAVITDAELPAYVEGLRALLDDPDRRSRMACACRRRAPDFTIEAMSHRFVEGLLQALSPAVT